MTSGRKWPMRGGGMVWAFETAVRTILKLTVGTEAVQMRETMTKIVDMARESNLTYHELVQEFKRQYIIRVLDANRGNQSRSARELGMHRNTMARTISELNINMRELQDKHPRFQPTVQKVDKEEFRRLA